MSPWRIYDRPKTTQAPQQGSQNGGPVGTAMPTNYTPNPFTQNQLQFMRPNMSESPYLQMFLQKINQMNPQQYTPQSQVTGKAPTAAPPQGGQNG